MHQIISTDEMIGIKVHNTHDQDIGRIEAVMLDKIQGHVAYIILSFEGFLARGHKLFVLPWPLFSYDRTTDCFLISVDKITLKNSPSFDKHDWPDMSSSTWRNTINRYYGISPNRAQH